MSPCNMLDTSLDKWSQHTDCRGHLACDSDACCLIFEATLANIFAASQVRLIWFPFIKAAFPLQEEAMFSFFSCQELGLSYFGS